MKRIKFNLNQITLFADWLLQCVQIAPTAETHTLNELLKFHFTQLAEKMHRKSLHFTYRNVSEVTMVFNRGDMLTLSWAFKYVNCPAYLLGLQNKIISGL